MTLLLLPVGLLLPAVIGWLLLRLVEGRTRVVYTGERIVCGTIIGLTLSMHAMFLLHVYAGIPLVRNGYVLMFGLLLLPLLLLYLLQRKRRMAPVDSLPPLAQSSRLSFPLRIILGMLAVWTIIKLAAMGSLLVLTPTYFDDSMDNWNMRGKLFFETHRLELVLPGDTAVSGISSYPPTVPLAKTWLATLGGTWDEGLINSIHLVWSLACVILLYYALRRKMSLLWSLTGAYVLTSLPLFLMQGMNAYADVFLSVHLFLPLIFMWHAMNAPTRAASLSFLRLAAVCTVLVPVIKNEGLILYTPALLAVMTGCLTVLFRRRHLSGRDMLSPLLFTFLLLVIVTLPWLLFKWKNGLAFGNAQSLSGFSVSWHPGTLYAIVINTFFEGNWLLFFPFLIGLLILQWKKAFLTPLFVLTFFFLGVYTLQLVLYLFTGLSSEAIMQTGYARGLIHIIPTGVLLGMLLLHDALQKPVESGKLLTDH